MAGVIYDQAAVQAAILRGGRRAGLQSERARSWAWFERNPRLIEEQWSFVAPCDVGHASLLRSMLFSGALQLRAAAACDGQCVIAELPE